MFEKKLDGSERADYIHESEPEEERCYSEDNATGASQEASLKIPLSILQNFQPPSLAGCSPDREIRVRSRALKRPSPGWGSRSGSPFFVVT